MFLQSCVRILFKTPKKLEKVFDVRGTYYMVFLNPWTSTLKVGKVFYLEEDFLCKSILTGCTNLCL